VIPVHELRKTLNPNNAPDFDAVAVNQAMGVFETLKAIAKLVLIQLKKN
jgi:hypothetical protein